MSEEIIFPDEPVQIFVGWDGWKEIWKYVDPSEINHGQLLDNGLWEIKLCTNEVPQFGFTGFVSAEELHLVSEKSDRPFLHYMKNRLNNKS